MELCVLLAEVEADSLPGLDEIERVWARIVACVVARPNTGANGSIVLVRALTAASTVCPNSIFSLSTLIDTLNLVKSVVSGLMLVQV